MAEITAEELNERVALLRRFRKLLEQQRAKFQEYLTVLEKQQNSITEENTEALIAHTELERQVVSNIANLQKVIVPMSRMCNPAVKQNSDESLSITNIQKDLNELQTKVLRQNQINQDLLKVHLEQIQSQMKTFKNPYKNLKSVYASKQPVASLVAIEV